MYNYLYVPLDSLILAKIKNGDSHRGVHAGSSTLSLELMKSVIMDNMKQIVRIPRWKIGIENTDNPLYDFAKQYVAGKKRVRWEFEDIRVVAEDPVWLRDACAAMTKLARNELCVLYTYTTPIFNLVTGLLRHKGPSATFDTGLTHKAATEWMFGSLLFFRSVEDGTWERYINRHDAVKDIVSELEGTLKLPHSDKKLDKMDALYAQLKPNFNLKLLRSCHDKSLEYNNGIVLFAQARRLFARCSKCDALLQPCDANICAIAKHLKDIKDFKRVVPHITSAGWVGMLELLIRDLDAVFLKMPPLYHPIHVYRGTKTRVTKSRAMKDPSFISTSLSESVAKDFYNPQEKCCVTTFLLPTGSCVVPMLPITRYWGEYEVLLPRPHARTHYDIVLAKQPPRRYVSKFDLKK